MEEGDVELQELGKDDVEMKLESGEGQFSYSPRPRDRRWIYYVLIAAACIALLAAGGITLALYVKYPPPPEREQARTNGYDPYGKERVLLISIDAFRWAYFATPNRFNDPDLHPRITQLASEGVAAPLYPVFPSLTFPNHYTIATGLYPAEVTSTHVDSHAHGIVSNDMYDAATKKEFHLGTPEAEDPMWWGGEPIWVTARKQGLRSATCFWPGSDVEIMGPCLTSFAMAVHPHSVRPNYYMPYDGTLPYRDRVNKILEWLDKPHSERPHFLSLYFEGVDHMGHEEGPWGDGVRNAIKEVDNALGYLFDEIEKREHVRDELSIVLVSDHGMTGISRDRVVFLDDFINMTDVRVIAWTPVALIQPKEGLVDKIYNTLKQLDHVSVYRKFMVPEMYHYRDNDRIAEIVAIAKEGWTIGNHEYFDSSPTHYTGGAHGYDHTLPSMRATVAVRGKFFRNDGDLSALPVSNIHLYSAMCAILGLEAAPNSGSVMSLTPLINITRILDIV